MADNEKVMFMLGQIKGQLEGMNKKLDSIDGIDERLRQTEIQASKNGAVSGGAISVGIAILAEGIKHAFK